MGRGETGATPTLLPPFSEIVFVTPNIPPLFSSARELSEGACYTLGSLILAPDKAAQIGK